MRDLLDLKLLSQPFETSSNSEQLVLHFRQVARTYASLENCLAVLSDMRARKSYLYYGEFAGQLGLEQKEEEIPSIWEDELLSRIHPEDLQKKYRLEFQFFELLNGISVEERSDLEVLTKLRVRDLSGRYLMMQHRLLYLSSSSDGSIWLALCLYHRVYEHPEFGIPDGLILNKKTGLTANYSHHRFKHLLSSREQEILRFIRAGLRSKEMADQLKLSIYTVSRHRQNILRKLNVSNAFEACRVAENMGLLE